MATLTVKEVRQRIESAIEQALPRWKKSTFTYDKFGQDPRAELHLSFAVGVPETVWASPIESSVTRRATTGGRVQTSVGVRWGYRIRSDAAVADQDLALDMEDLIRAAIMSSSNDTNLHLWVERASRSSRDIDAGILLIGDLSIGSQHLLAV